MKFVFILFSLILPGSFCANILVVFPHISYSHFRATSKLVTELEVNGHNVTLISPFSIGNIGYKNIKEISLDGIVDPINRFRIDFFDNSNDPTSYWSKLQYAKKIGYQYASHVLQNENITELINSDSVFDLVLVEDVSADALNIFSYIFKCPLVVLLSEPLSVFYENYFFDNIQWKKPNDLRNAHHYVIKELYREWIILPEQNQILKAVLPDAPDLRDILYNTSLIFIPSYPNLGNLVSKYNNVKQIGGFHIEKNNTTPSKLTNLNITKKGKIIVSDDIKKSSTIGILLKANYLPDILWESNTSVEDIFDHENVTLFLGNGDIYDTSNALYNGVPVVSVIYNEWFEQFLVDALVEKKAALGLPFDEPLDLLAIEDQISSHNNRCKECAELASRIIRTEQTTHPIDNAMFWIEYVIKFHGAHHLRSCNLQSDLNRHLIEIIILLVIIDVLLFLIFYWIFTHLLSLNLGLWPKKVFNAVRNKFRRNNNFQSNISYIKI